MGYAIDAGLLAMTLLFGILGVRTLSIRGKANNEMIDRHLAIQWQDVKSPLPQSNFGLTFVFLIISFISMLGFIVSVTVIQ